MQRKINIINSIGKLGIGGSRGLKYFQRWYESLNNKEYIRIYPPLQTACDDK